MEGAVFLIPADSRRAHALAAAVLLAVVLAVFSPSLSGEFIHWDDDVLITENPAVQAMTPGTLKTIFTTYDPELYIPLTLLSYQINFLIAGPAPFLYHLTNTLLHAGNAFLVACIAYRLFRRQAVVALLAGFLFAVHPLQTEAVAWISARKDVLSAFFFLAATLLFLRHLERPSARRYLGIALLFLLALLSKANAVVFPVLLLLLVWYREGSVRRRDIVLAAPFFALSVLFGVVAVLGKSAQAGILRPWEFLLMSARSMAFYIEKLLLPVRLSALYPFEGAVTLASFPVLASCIFLLSLFLAATWRYRRSRWPLIALLSFGVLLAPSFINYRKGFAAADLYFASDRYAYLASVVFFFLLARLLERGMTRRLVPAAALPTAIVLLWSGLSFVQAGVWRSNIDLFTHVLGLYPSAYAAENNLGMTYYRLGELDRAEEHYHKALAIRPLAITWSNLGTLYRREGKLPKSAHAFQEALRINPGEHEAHFGRGILLAQAGQFREAEEAYRTAMALDPKDPGAPLNLGALYMLQGRYAEAVGQYQRALAIHPYYANAHYNLGVAYRRLGNAEEARRSFENALKYRPDMEQAEAQLREMGYPEDPR